MRLADLIGLTARSHGTSLRVCKSYLESSPLYLGTPTPMGTAVLYPMALLRVADYLQIDRQRAPAVRASPLLSSTVACRRSPATRASRA